MSEIHEYLSFNIKKKQKSAKLQMKPARQTPRAVSAKYDETETGNPAVVRGNFPNG
jgi:hypothetical protein